MEPIGEGTRPRENGRPGCRARPGPVLGVEALVREQPGLFRPADLAAALAGEIEPPAVAEVVAHLLAAGRIALDDEGYLVWKGRAGREAHGDAPA